MPGSIDKITLNPNLSYLRVTVGGDRAVLMVLGYLEPTPSGPIETWYSSEGEVLLCDAADYKDAIGVISPIPPLEMNASGVIPSGTQVHVLPLQGGVRKELPSWSLSS